MFYYRKEVSEMNTNKLMEVSTAFAIAAGGVLLATVSVTMGSAIKVNKARAINLTADAGRLISLSKKYDAKAAVDNLKVLKDII